VFLKGLGNCLPVGHEVTFGPDAFHKFPVVLAVKLQGDSDVISYYRVPFAADGQFLVPLLLKSESIDAGDEHGLAAALRAPSQILAKGMHSNVVLNELAAELLRNAPATADRMRSHGHLVDARSVFEQSVRERLLLAERDVNGTPFSMLNLGKYSLRRQNQVR